MCLCGLFSCLMVCTTPPSTCNPIFESLQGNTSLHFATAYGYSALAKYLMSKGADDTLMNMKGLTCYDGIG